MTLTTGTLRLGTAGTTTTVIRYEIVNSYGTYKISQAKGADNAPTVRDSMRDYAGYNHLHQLVTVAAAWADPDMTVTWTDNNAGETGYRIERKLNAGSYSFVANDTTSPYNDTPTCGPSNTYYYQIRAYIGTQYALWKETAGELADCCLLDGNKLQVKPNEFKNIEDIKVGDLLYTAHQHDLSDMGYFEVSTVEKNKVDSYYIINFGDGSRIRCSKTHRFALNGERISVKNLKIGDVVHQFKGEFRDLMVTNILDIQQEAFVYKITVPCAHTYITEDGILHHNEK